MSRPPKQRQVSVKPPYDLFKPAGVRMFSLEEVMLTIDELEALQLAHLEGFYQLAIARRMGVSRQTAARILESAHRKVSEALIEGKALRLDGGPVVNSPRAVGLCPRCGRTRGCDHPRGQGRRHGKRHGGG